jgi:hypothetical protein
MSNIDKRALREAAEKATPGPWGIARNGKTITSNQSHPVAVITEDFHRMLANGKTGGDAEFIAAANPTTVLALLDELEAKEEQRANWFQMAEKLGADLDAAEKRIAELEARDKPKFVQCWSCKHDIEVLAIADCDGYCPRCAAPIDLDDEPYAAAGKGE